MTEKDTQAAMQKFFMTCRVEKLWQFVQTRKVKAEKVLTAVGKAEDYDLPCMLFSSVILQWGRKTNIVIH